MGVVRQHGFDPELDRWVSNLARMQCGSFLQSIYQAVVCADPENYELLRPLLLELKKKYPKYSEVYVVRGI